jgi:hypothetical protein
LVLVALICLIGTQVVFWVFTFPVNQATQNWTVPPANWTELRSRWEYSHATSAALNLLAFLALALAWVDQPGRDTTQARHRCTTGGRQ